MGILAESVLRGHLDVDEQLNRTKRERFVTRSTKKQNKN